MKVWNKNYTHLNLQENLFKINKVIVVINKVNTLMVSIFVICNFIFFILLYLYFVRFLFSYIIAQSKFRSYNKTE